MGWGEIKGEQFTQAIDDQVEFEAKEPSHTALTSLGNTSENPIAADTLVVADRQWSRVNKGNPGRLPEPTTQLESQGGLRRSHQFYKAAVTDQTRKFYAQMLTNVLGIVRLEIAMLRRWPSLPPDVQQFRILPFAQPLTETIDMTEHFEYTHLERLPWQVGFG